MGNVGPINSRLDGTRLKESVSPDDKKGRIIDRKGREWNGCGKKSWFLTLSA